MTFRGNSLTRGTEITEYLEATYAPETLLAATAYGMGDRLRNHTIGSIFPESRNQPSHLGQYRNFRCPGADLERILEFNPGVYMGWYTLAEPIERIGLSFVGFKTFPTSKGNAILEKDDDLFRQLDENLHATPDMLLSVCIGAYPISFAKVAQIVGRLAWPFSSPVHPG